MSKEATVAGMVVGRIVREVWGLATGTAVLVCASLIAVHLLRKSDRGLLHWPGRPDRPIYIGGPPEERLKPVTPSQPIAGGLAPKK